MDEKYACYPIHRNDDRKIQAKNDEHTWAEHQLAWTLHLLLLLLFMNRRDSCRSARTRIRVCPQRLRLERNRVCLHIIYIPLDAFIFIFLKTYTGSDKATAAMSHGYSSNREGDKATRSSHCTEVKCSVE